MREDLLDRPIPLSQAARLVPHKSFNRAQLVLCAGRRENGKTAFLSEYIETREPRILALDPFDDFHGLRRRLSLEDALDDLERYPTACRRRVVPPISVEIDAEGNAKPTIATRRYAQRVFAELVSRNIRNVLLLLDELTLWTTPQGDALLELVTLQGRRLNLRIATAIQRLALTPGVLQSEVTELVMFKTSRPRDLDTLRDWVERNEIAESVAKLKVGECVVTMP